MRARRRLRDWNVYGDLFLRKVRAATREEADRKAQRIAHEIGQRTGMTICDAHAEGPLDGGQEGDRNGE